MADVSPLAAQLSDASSAARAAAAEQLARLGEGASGAAVPLVRAAADADESVREWVTAALEELGPPSADDCGALAELLTSPRADVGYWAATLLGRLEGEAAPAVPAFAAVLSESPHGNVRERAAWALGRINVADENAIAALRKAAASDAPRLARLAQSALQRLTGE